MKVKIENLGVFHGGEEIAIGVEIKLDSASGMALIASGHAVEVVDDVINDGADNEDALKGQNKAENGVDVQTPAEEPEDALTGTEQSHSTMQAVDMDKVKKAIDGQYKRDELYEAAIKAGVEIAYNATKAEMVEAIIAQEKYSAVLR